MKKLAMLLACTLMIMLACTAVAESVSIAVVYSDAVDDKSWCQSMHSGIEKAIRMGCEIEYTPLESVSVADAPNTINQLVGSYDIIVVHGSQFTAVTSEIADDNPEQVFAQSSSDQILGSNVFTYMPMSEEPGYVHGIIAAMASKTGKVGIVGSTDGGDSARYVRGFVKGLKDTNADAEYMLSWTGSFSDTVSASAIVKTFIAADCDILIGPSQQAVGALRNIDVSDGVLWLGQTTNQIVDFPDIVAAAADYDYSAVIVSLVEHIAAGKTGGESIPLNYHNGGFVYTFSENAEILPQNARDAAQAALDALTAAPDTINFSDVELM